MTHPDIEQADLNSLRWQLTFRWRSKLNAHEVDDLIGEVLRVYCTKLRAGYLIDKPVSWCKKAAELIAKKMICQLSEVHKYEKSEDTAALANREDRCCEVVSNRKDNDLSHLLNKLSNEKREVVVRCVMHDTSLADVARDLGIKYSTARSHMVRGIGQLRRLAISAETHPARP